MQLKSQSKVLFAEADMENKQQNDVNTSSLQCFMKWPVNLHLAPKNGWVARINNLLDNSAKSQLNWIK